MYYEKQNYITLYVENILKYNQNATTFYMALYDESLMLINVFHFKSHKVFVLMKSSH